MIISKQGLWISFLALLFLSTNAVAQASLSNETGRASLGPSSGPKADAIDTAQSRSQQGPARVWQMTGPFGGDVVSLAIDPRHSQRLLIGTNDGQIFRSADGGATWRRVKPGLKAPGFAITVIIFDRERPNVVYAGASQIKDARDDASGGGVFRSEDGGDTWQEYEALRGRSVRGLVQAAKDPNVLAVAARDGIYRSLDHGATWQRLTPESDPELRGFHSLAIDPRDVDTIYVGTWHLPWKTTDGGKTWKRAGSKETGMIDDSDIFAITIDEAHPDTVLMSACSGIYRSLDASAKWTKLQGIPYTSRRTHVIYRHPTRPEVIFAGTTEGLWRTTDNGQNWSRVTPLRLVINAVAIHPDQPDRVYLGTDDVGILISNDGGESYETSNAGFISRQVRVVLADRTERGRIYAGVIFDSTSGGLFVSEDGGITWQQSMKGMGVRDVYSLYQSESNPETILAGTNYGLFRSDDHGRSWAPVKRVEEQANDQAQSESNQPTPSAVASSPLTRPRSVKSAAAPRVKPVVQTRSKGSARRTAHKRGPTKSSARPRPQVARQTPKPAPSEFTDLQNQVFALAPLTPRNETERPGLVAATWDGLFRTDDEKKGWKQLKFTAAGSSRVSINTIATSPQAPGLILIGTEDGLHVSRDQGESFAPLPLDEEPRRVRVILFDPRTAETIYVGTTNGFFRSTDGGRSWEQRGGGMRMLVTVSALAINPLNPDELYLGDSSQGGFFHSRDRGKNWEPLDISALPSWRLWSLVADPFDSSRIYAGSFSGGVYVMTRQAAGR
jgi:photosystem II stability/assembly factor-like uncharacterized protein